MSDRSAYESQSDSELVQAWQKKRNETALNTLVERHYQTIFKRIDYRVHNTEDAKEVTQDVFIKLIKSLDNYKDEGKFPNFLNTIASTQMIDFFRKNGKKFDADELKYEMHDNDYMPNDGSDLQAERKIEHLTTHCIPHLPPKERLVFLLLHESELWDFDTPLEWSHLAALNGIDKQTAWERFESARESLMQGTPASEVDMEELLIFLVWTQAKRPFKAGKTLKQFAALLGESEQNLRNWSHRATKKLNDCMGTH